MIFSLLRSLVLICLITEISALSCLDVKRSYEKTCLELEHDNYVQCVKTRLKRNPQDCSYSDNCYDCDCDLCLYSECGGQCDHCCNSCCSNYIQCHSNHCCHKQCHSECRTYSCRSSCRKSCYETLEREREQERKRNGKFTPERMYNERIIQIASADGVDHSTKQDYKVNNTNLHNITTIINLKNVLNNTNILDVPINLTYTNKNNITLRDKTSTSDGTHNNCCIVIGPRQCVPASIYPYTRCFHTRSTQCGSYCLANIVHEERRQICNSLDSFGQPTNCQQQTAYIPQPQPRCTYTSTWPYVSCNIQPPAACEGCYSHYYNTNVKQYKTCPPQCYDDFSVGPLYRQGPFYQPRFSHIPSCAYSPQGCSNAFGTIVGGYGFGSGIPGFVPEFGGQPSLGTGVGYAGLLSGQPVNPSILPWFPYPSNSINETEVNGTLFSYSVLPEDHLLKEYQANMMQLGPLRHDKEVEIDVSITKPDVSKMKRGVRENQNRDDVSVVKV